VCVCVCGEVVWCVVDIVMRVLECLRNKQIGRGGYVRIYTYSSSTVLHIAYRDVAVNTRKSLSTES
jgi:hypothetical protein